ncbi:MAG: hypothetical protein E7315_02170 [Clostridiales bacterium]|nr:hypothetical protein [Clostridiales bacterium]
MGFIDAYKRLEKLCGEVFGPERPVSTYIDEMLNTPKGPYLVKGWDDDLRKLKHYRWVRNKISHEPGCTEENMCDYGDEQWLEVFYKRIMNQTDPLAMYHKAIQPKKTNIVKKVEKVEDKFYPKKQEINSVNSQTNQTKDNSGMGVLGAVTIVAGCILIFLLIVWYLVQ